MGQVTDFRIAQLESRMRDLQSKLSKMEDEQRLAQLLDQIGLLQNEIASLASLPSDTV